MADPDGDTVFKLQYQMAWDHFRFHAEQRTKVFHFFLITAALLVNAFSFLTQSEVKAFQDHAFLILCMGGILSTIFLGLDVRNTQLLEQSEALLREIEEKFLYKGWSREIEPYGEITLGIFAREAVLKNYVRDNDNIPTGSFRRWFCVDNIKHKFSIRFIEIFAIFFFWVSAILTTPTSLPVPFLGQALSFRSLEFGLLMVCIAWIIHAMVTPAGDLRREHAAFINRSQQKQKKNTKR